MLHIITGLSTGGAERSLYNLLVHDSYREHYESAVISLRDEGTFGRLIKAKDLPLQALDIRGPWPSPRSLRALWQAGRAFRPQIIQGWMYHGNLAASVLTALLPGLSPAAAWNVMHCLHDLPGEKASTRWALRIGRTLSPMVDALIYNGHASREQHEAFGFAPRSGHVIPSGFDPAAFRPAADEGASMRRRLHIPGDALVIGHVARYHPIKDHANFLRAAVRLGNTWPNATFLMVGRGTDGRNAALQEHIPSRMRKRFRLLGERADVPHLLQMMDVFCQSSRSEAFPNALGEAMASGVPCVATDVGDTSAMLAGTGIAVPASDDEALTKGLSAMLKLSPCERQRLGRAARQRVIERFEMDTVAHHYHQLYSRVLADRETRPNRWTGPQGKGS
ncbi:MULTISPECIES: glycosyltransferase [unclassified Thioalkalivibrio]|uniref:glycosyltransferase n=1 Tax=unclassified Thioalkalivibrio TaxID=2621013 RepID=UPI000366876B|nr:MULTISPECIES: glycosyltransferase [unclassified Thioalkalivibrio]